MRFRIAGIAIGGFFVVASLACGFLFWHGTQGPGPIDYANVIGGCVADTVFFGVGVFLIVWAVYPKLIG